MGYLISAAIHGRLIVEATQLSNVGNVSYRGYMAQRCTIVAKRRPEAEVPRRWGLYALEEERWLPVLFVNASEADEAVRVLNGERPTIA